MVWKIRALQADADVQLVTAEAGQASQELADALDEYRRISEECDKLKQEAKDLNAAFNAYMYEKGKSAEDVAELIAVPSLDDDSDCRPPPKPSQLSSWKRNLRAKKLHYERIRP